MKFIYLENGSGADGMVDSKLINYLSSNLDIPIIVGGGIKSYSQIDKIKSSGANFIVISTILEENPNSTFISEFSALFDSFSYTLSIILSLVEYQLLYHTKYFSGPYLSRA